MNSDATEAALGLLSLSPLNNNTIPQIRKPVQIPTPRPPPTTTPTQPALSAGPPLPDADAISCICGFLFDDGFSIACDVCSRWCHAACFDIVEGEVPEEWRCWDCDPRPVDRDRAVRLQKQRITEMHVRERERDKEKDRDKGKKRDRAGSPVQRRRASAAAIEGSGNTKKKRRASIISPSTPHPPPTPIQQGEDEPVDIDEPWSLSYVPITKDIVTTEAHARLRRQAQAWRGITALSPPIHPNRTQIHSVPPTPSPSQLHTNPLVRPPTYSLHTTTPVPSSSYIAPFTCAITPSASYLADPLNAYAHLGMPKPFVHLMGPPLDVALDARVVGDEGRFARSGCRPNAVLRPLLCRKAKDESKAKESSEKERTESVKKERRESGKKKKNDKTDSDEETLTFGVFALRDLKANEEVVLGWEWDDGNAVHSLPALIESPHLYSTYHLTHLRAQMTSILHALSSTFTTCACGARARDCVLNVMAQYVDSELDASSVTCASGQPMNGTGGMMNGNGARQAGEADAGDGSSSDKENWGHDSERTVVGLGIQMNANSTSTNGNGANINTNGLNGNTPSSPAFTRKIDLGPLIGAKRGFRTREKVPFGGGVGGVEMIPSGSGVSFDAESTEKFGAELSGRFDVRSSGRSSSAGPDAWPSSFNTPAESSGLGPNGGPSNWRPTISTSSQSRTLNCTRTSDRKGKRRAPEETDVDADVDVEGDGPTPDSMDVNEENIPPRMRKRWMHTVSVSVSHDRDERASSRNKRNFVSINAQSPSGSHGQHGQSLLGVHVHSSPVLSGHSPPAPVSTTDWRSPTSLSADSPAPTSGDSPSPSPESTVDGMDIDVNDTFSADPLSIDIRQMPPPPMPAALDPTTISSVAFASVSPSATFSKLSLLSPVLPDMRSGSPSLFGVPLTNSSRRPMPMSSPPPPQSSNSKSPSDALSAQVTVYPQPSNPSMSSASSPHRVRFASPEVLHGQPCLKTTQHTPLNSGRQATPPIYSHTPPPVLEDDKTAGSAAEAVLQPDRSPVHDGTSLEVKIVPPDEAPQTGVSISTIMRDSTTLVPSICESTPSLHDSDSPPPSCEPALPIHESTPATHELSPPAYEPTPPAREQSPLPPPKVKMSLKDFALRKKKQREEMAKERECESPGGLSMGLLEESGDEGIHVDDDGADERLGRDSEGTDHERDLEVTMSDIREVRDVEMDGDNDVGQAVERVKDEPDASFTLQNVVDCVLEDSPAESQRRCESEPRGATPYPPRSPVASLRSVRSMDNAHPNGQLADPTSLVTKVEISETSIPNGLVGAYDRTSPFAPDPPPPPLHQQIKGTEKQSSSPKTFSSPLPPSAPASYSLRPSHEDGEITSASPPKSSHFFPRSYTPPTQPRSFQTSHPLSPNFTHTTSTPTPSSSWRGPPPPTRAPSSNTPSSNGPPRPLPSGPRALRVSQSSHPPTYSSPSSRVYSGSQYIPRGPSADRDRHDRDRLDWERERGWAPRPRGRTGSSGWGR
ncbi:uncharacterized protein F5891DRAFT_1068515 [Suillus fuscotomentosus]|uniref:PHD-type domain-containing protein n=1 Tax=Suillus fuscotomentosus TaxID=1912939 RepID=A0AAD4DS08_9AGAM|nr:uncharacterized protein F5891DRAFT_1068515 [Suillus fuscotomentosus]KAG1892868.1 hypothetical protein F5891DRAFT_1068515 [Suillus fuscotomentosus]